MDLTVAEVQRRQQAFYHSDETGSGDPRVSEVTLLGSGFETDVYGFSLQTVKDGPSEVQHLVLRVYTGEGSSKKSARVRRDEPAASSRILRTARPDAPTHPPASGPAKSHYGTDSRSLPGSVLMPDLDDTLSALLGSAA